MPNAGLNHRVSMWLEPSRQTATVLYAVVAAGLIGLAVKAPVPPALNRPAPGLGLGVGLFTAAVGTMALLSVLATLVNARRWRTYRKIVRMSEDRALGSVLPAVQSEPAGRTVLAPPPLRVTFRAPPRFRHRVRGLGRVAIDANVLGRCPMNIIYLRVFENRARARTFARGAWREFGPVFLLRSAAAIGPAELRRARRSGGLDQLLVRSRDQLLAELDAAPAAPDGPGWRRLDTIAGGSVLTFDRFGGYPVHAPMCHGEFWRDALDELLARADLVVLDLAGYRQRFAGTQFELQRLVDRVPVERVLLLADPKSNRRFLTAQVEEAWARMAADSPNAGPGPKEINGGITDFFVQVDQRQAGSSNTSSSTRLELHHSRAQTRRLLRDAQLRLDQVPSGVRARFPDPTRRSDFRTADTDRTIRTEVHDRGLDGRTRHRLRGVAVAAAVLAVLAAGLVALAPTGTSLVPVDLIGWLRGGTPATVKAGETWNVRGQPAMCCVEGQVGPSQDLLVECLRGGWARLADPHPGGYVHTKGLVMSGSPPPC